MKILNGFRSTALVFSLLLSISLYSHGATINVSSAGEFIEALNSAEHGDVISVASGTYDLTEYDFVDITKAVTIIGESLLDRPTMHVAFRFSIPDGTDDMHLVIQNLHLPGTGTREGLQLNSYESSVIGSISIVDVNTVGNTYADITVRNNAKKINVLGVYASTVYMDPNGSGTRVLLAYSDITGADIDSTSTTLPVDVRGNVSELIMVGNTIDGSFGSSSNATSYLVRIRPEVLQSYIFGNHFRFVQFRNNTNEKYAQMLYIDSSSSLISNNLFTIEPVASGGYLAVSAAEIGLRLRSIFVSPSTGNVKIQNNVFDYSLDVEGVSSRAMVVTQAPTTIKNNIFRGDIGNDVVVLQSTPSEDSIVANNLCFEVGDYCPSGATNISADPLFTNVDLDKVRHERDYDYSLLEGSPGINAGLEGTAYFDVDGSRVDIGYNGGATPFDQYSRSIIEFRSETIDSRPYVIPLIRASQGVAGDNTLRVKFLTFARSR